MTSNGQCNVYNYTTTYYITTPPTCVYDSVHINTQNDRIVDTGELLQRDIDMLTRTVGSNGGTIVSEENIGRKLNGRSMGLQRRVGELDKHV